MARLTLEELEARIAQYEKLALKRPLWDGERERLANYIKRKNDALAQRRYREKNREKLNAKRVKWSKDNPEKAALRSRVWRNRNPGKNAEWCRRWRENRQEVQTP